MQHWRGISGSHGATFSNNYRNRLVDWYLENPRPDDETAPIHAGFVMAHFIGDPKLEERIKNDLAVTVRFASPSTARNSATTKAVPGRARSPANRVRSGWSGRRVTEPNRQSNRS